MEIEWKIFILNFFVVFPISFLVKGRYHFKYLKLRNNDMVSDYSAFEEAYSLRKWNHRIQALIFPYFMQVREFDEASDDENKKATSLEVIIKVLVVYQLTTIVSIIAVILISVLG